MCDILDDIDDPLVIERVRGEVIDWCRRRPMCQVVKS